MEEELKAAFDEEGLDPDVPLSEHFAHAKCFLEAVKHVCFKREGAKYQAWGQTLDSAWEVINAVEEEL